jgi:hypothetical protein
MPLCHTLLDIFMELVGNLTPKSARSKPFYEVPYGFQNFFLYKIAHKFGRDTTSQQVAVVFAVM